VEIAWDDEKRGTSIVLESFFASRQRLVDDPTFEVSKPYAVTGILFSRWLGRRYKVFANVENLTDLRQTKHAPLVRRFEDMTAGSHWTVGPWAPLVGRTFSIGVRQHSGASR
jgi:hypothetical protein